MSVVKINVYGEKVLATEVGNGVFFDIYGRILKMQAKDVSRTRNVPEKVKEKFKEIERMYSKESVFMTNICMKGCIKVRACMKNMH